MDSKVFRNDSAIHTGTHPGNFSFTISRGQNENCGRCKQKSK